MCTGRWQEAKRAGTVLQDLPALLDAVQLTHDAKAAPAQPDPCVQCCLTAAADQQAVYTFVDAVCLPCHLFIHSAAAYTLGQAMHP